MIFLDGQFFQTDTNQNMYTQMLDRNLLFLGKPHPVRIARVHVGYLEAYKQFIDQNAKLDSNTRNEISIGISNEIRDYVKTISELLEINRTDPIKHFEAPFDNIDGWIAQAQQKYLNIEHPKAGNNVANRCDL